VKCRPAAAQRTGAPASAPPTLRALSSVARPVLGAAGPQVSPLRQPRAEQTGSEDLCASKLLPASCT